ncbi:NAD(P)/FAD-dependent oxidoreductase [Prauserella alba]|uniref:FAD-dependent oxidoreductase n=1 Tax=Prauserella alba TaxID=176898 RepID=A0ABN1V6W1_9PSEU|nr:FAD-dependent oxidoreductase [Prauserella alba]MCP2181194.1 hypothetical protein [Prauserella alba]
MTEPTVAVIGAGVSGLTAAYLLSRRYRVTLFDADDRLGGHAHTHDVVTSDGRAIAVDSGFIVHNERTYPNLMRLFDELGVATQDTEMSMSVRCAECGLTYAGAKGLTGLFAEPASLARPAYLRLLAQVRRFHRSANELLDVGTDDHSTLGAFLADGRYSQFFVDHFAVPLVSAVWSAGPEISLRYPARYLFEFLRNHGMLSVGGSPAWRTVVGGSRSYVDRIGKQLHVVRVSAPVRSVLRRPEGVEIRGDDDTVHVADHAVVATHADDALHMLAAPTAAEREILGAFTYSRNEAVLHTDARLVPAGRRARASWNYWKPACAAGTDEVRVSYDMNRLMRLAEPEDYIVTLGDVGRVDPRKVIAAPTYRHPIYTPESVAAQRRLHELADDRVSFAGAYHGWGFHEDGCASGVRVAENLGAGWGSR